MADALTALRLALVAPFAYLVMRGDLYAIPIATALFVVAVASDFADGWVARRTGTASPAGRLLDHVTDFLFVTAGLGAAATRGVVPGWLPVLIVAAFVQYVLDSYWLGRERELRMSQLGRWNGIFYFVALGGVLVVDLGIDFGLGLADPALRVLCYALGVTTVLSMGDRLLALDRSRR